MTYVCMQQLAAPLASAKSQKAKIKQMAHLSRKLLNVSKDVEWEYFNPLDCAVQNRYKSTAPQRQKCYKNIWASTKMQTVAMFLNLERKKFHAFLTMPCFG